MDVVLNRMEAQGHGLHGYVSIVTRASRTPGVVLNGGGGVCLVFGDDISS